MVYGKKRLMRAVLCMGVLATMGMSVAAAGAASPGAEQTGTAGHEAGQTGAANQTEAWGPRVGRSVPGSILPDGPRPKMDRIYAVPGWGLVLLWPEADEKKTRIGDDTRLILLPWKDHSVEGSLLAV